MSLSRALVVKTNSDITFNCLSCDKLFSSCPKLYNHSLTSPMCETQTVCVFCNTPIFFTREHLIQHLRHECIRKYNFNRYVRNQIHKGLISQDGWFQSGSRHNIVLNKVSDILIYNAYLQRVANAITPLQTRPSVMIMPQQPPRTVMRRVGRSIIVTSSTPPSPRKAPVVESVIPSSTPPSPRKAPVVESVIPSSTPPSPRKAPVVATVVPSPTPSSPRKTPVTATVSESSTADAHADTPANAPVPEATSDDMAMVDASQNPYDQARQVWLNMSATLKKKDLLIARINAEHIKYKNRVKARLQKMKVILFKAFLKRHQATVNRYENAKKKWEAEKSQLVQECNRLKAQYEEKMTKQKELEVKNNQLFHECIDFKIQQDNMIKQHETQMANQKRFYEMSQKKIYSKWEEEKNQLIQECNTLRTQQVNLIRHHETQMAKQKQVYEANQEQIHKKWERLVRSLFDLHVESAKTLQETWNKGIAEINTVTQTIFHHDGEETEDDTDNESVSGSSGSKRKSCNTPPCVTSSPAKRRRVSDLPEETQA